MFLVLGLFSVCLFSDRFLRFFLCFPSLSLDTPLFLSSRSYDFDASACLSSFSSVRTIFLSVVSVLEVVPNIFKDCSSYAHAHEACEERKEDEREGL